MSENTRTLIFAVLGALFLVVAWLVRPADPIRQVVDDSGERFFDSFDPVDATSLEVVTFDEDLGVRTAFQVESSDGVWTIPSHDGYPADAKDHLGQAAAAISDLVKGPRVSDRRGDHVLYGVIDPDEADAGASGVGTRVRVGQATSSLVDIIIGKPVKDRAQLRYVRVPGIDRVYTAEVDLSALTTRFEDWIEDDLLDLDPSDITNLLVDDYSIDEVNRQMIQGPRMLIARDPANRTWSLEGLEPGEQVTASRLDAITRALDDLRIVDVVPKPEGLSTELRTDGDMQLDSAAVTSLRSRGFYIVDGRLISNEGDLFIGMSNGVEYVLRFGEIALDADAGELLDDEEADATPVGTNRYLFVSTQFNTELISTPELEDLPELPETPEELQEDENATAAIAEAIQQARTDAERRNRERQAEYDLALEDGRDAVATLNDRFADWYYVIPNDVYEQIRVTRDDIVEAAPVVEEGPAPPSP